MISQESEGSARIAIVIHRRGISSSSKPPSFLQHTNRIPPTSRRSNSLKIHSLRRDSVQATRIDKRLGVWPYPARVDYASEKAFFTLVLIERGTKTALENDVGQSLRPIKKRIQKLAGLTARVYLASWEYQGGYLLYKAVFSRINFTCWCVNQ